LIKDLFLLVAELLEEVAELRSEVKDLKSQLGKTSKNSNKPPSSDGYRKAAKLPKEKHSKGGQKGHKGNTLKFSKEVDKVLKHEPGACICGSRVEPSSI
jgi:hypothetical protein